MENQIEQNALESYLKLKLKKEAYSKLFGWMEMDMRCHFGMMFVWMECHTSPPHRTTFTNQEQIFRI